MSASPSNKTSSPNASRSNTLDNNLSKPAHNRRLSALNATSRSNSLQTNSNGNNKNISSEELERERAKIETLNELIRAAEEKEADAIQEANRWKSKVDQLTTTIERIETELADALTIKSDHERLTKELEKLKLANKEYERTQFQQAEEFEASRLAWAEEEANWRAKLAHANTQLASLQKEHSTQEDPEVSSSPSVSSNKNLEDDKKQATSNQSDDQTASLTAQLDALKAQNLTTQTSLEQALATTETLKAQLTDLERVNEQLMDDNESYQFLVGERTLMGGFDIKQLLRVDDDQSKASTPNLPRRSSSSTPTSSSLSHVEEEEEEEDDDDDEEEEDDNGDTAIERAVLESHGDGSLTTGAVEAGITKPKRLSKRRNEPTGLGLDLAAELAQAEESEVHKVKQEERKKTKKINKEKDQEIKALQDTNKALVLYISKILDRIAAHDGFEKVLSSDYSKDGSVRSARERARQTSSTAVFSAAKGPANLAPAATNPAPKRSSWLQYFGMKSPNAQTAGIKPLRLGNNNTTSSSTPMTAASSIAALGPWIGFKDTSEEEDPEACARERKMAEMKLHGLHKTESAEAEASKPKDATPRANRRSSSMYGESLSSQKTLKEFRRNSGEIGRASKLSLLPSIDSTLAPLTPSGLLKRNEEREKESKMNLEKGQASGFTEIEIRGHRMRPSAGRQMTNPNPSPPDCQAGFATTSGSKNPASTSPSGIKDLKMTGDLNLGAPNDHANEGLLARTARRISMMGASK